MAPDKSYFKNERLEVATAVDSSAKYILDVGCGSGTLGAVLKSIDPGRTVIGIELDPNAAEEARKVLDEVINADIENLNLTLSAGYFDCIVFADILEHLKDPVSALRTLKRYLKDGGAIVCSIPNMRHFTAFIHLLVHGWEYKDSGLFDRTHLRFFTLRPMKRMIADAGFTIELVRPKIDLTRFAKAHSGFRKNIDKIILQVYSKSARLFNVVTFGVFEEFLSYQYIIKARNK